MATGSCAGPAGNRVGGAAAERAAVAVPGRPGATAMSPHRRAGCPRVPRKDSENEGASPVLGQLRTSSQGTPCAHLSGPFEEKYHLNLKRFPSEYPGPRTTTKQSLADNDSSRI